MTDNYEPNGRAWWRHCSARERAYWREQAASHAPADAWQAYRRTLAAPRSVARRRDTPCPECGHRFTEVLSFPDGHAVFCRACGHRTLECAKP